MRGRCWGRLGIIWRGWSIGGSRRAKKREISDPLINGFPVGIKDQAKCVMQMIVQQHSSIEDAPVSEDAFNVSLGSETVSFPSRIYYDPLPEHQLNFLNNEQRTIVRCLYTRSHDGYVRQKSVEVLLDSGVKEQWVIPYIVKLCDDYVVEIVQTIYERRDLLPIDLVREFTDNNREFVQRCYQRMVSYWDCYYRQQVPRLQDYVGYHLFRDLLGVYSVTE